MIASNLGRHENAFVQIGQNASVSKSPRPYRSDRCQEVKLTSRMTVLGRVAARRLFNSLQVRALGRIGPKSTEALTDLRATHAALVSIAP